MIEHKDMTHAAYKVAFDRNLDWFARVWLPAYACWLEVNYTAGACGEPVARRRGA